MTLSLSDSVRQEGRTLFFDDRIEWQHIIFHRLVDDSSDLSKYQMRNRDRLNTKPTTCYPKILIRKLFRKNTVSYLKNKNVDNSDVSDRLWDLENERTNLCKRASIKWSLVNRSDARDDSLSKKKSQVIWVVIDPVKLELNAQRKSRWEDCSDTWRVVQSERWRSTWEFSVTEICWTKTYLFWNIWWLELKRHYGVREGNIFELS